MASRPEKSEEDAEDTVLATARLLPQCRAILETDGHVLDNELDMTRRAIGLALDIATKLLDLYNDKSTPEEKRPTILQDLREANSLTRDFISDWEEKKGPIRIFKN